MAAKGKAVYTLLDFARDWKAENGKTIVLDYRHKAWARLYRAQCHWNDRTAALLADATPWHERPVPQADWSPKGMAKWLRAQMSDWPEAQSQEAKAFTRALAAIPDSARDATPTIHRGACSECLYVALVAEGAASKGTYHRNAYMGASGRLAPIPHTCALAAPVADASHVAAASKGKARRARKVA